MEDGHNHDMKHHEMNNGDERKHDNHHEHQSHHGRMVEDFRKRFFVSLAITVPVLILSPLIQELLGFGDTLRFTGDLFVLFLLSSVIFFYGGYPFLKGIIDEIRQRQPGMMTLIAVAITTAYAYSSAVVFGLEGKIFFWELATLVDVMLLGHWMEMRSVMGASNALEELVKLMPSDAHKIMGDGSTHDVPLKELTVGDRVLVKPGEKIPADGVVVDGRSAVNESMLTGESIPVEKKEHDAVIGGAINGEGALTVEITKTGKDSFLSQMIELVTQAQESKSRTQDLANRAALLLTIVGLSAGAITLFVWFSLAGADFAFALERTVTVMVITCPHALGLAIPLVVAVSTALSARNGLLIRNRNAFEQARNITAILFDKTGTLTEGRFGVSDVVPIGGSNKEEVLLYAASVEAYSEHPIAQAIAQAVPSKKPADNFSALPGVGVTGVVEGKSVQVLSPGVVAERKLETNDARIVEHMNNGKTVVFVVVDEVLIGAIALGDVVRTESKNAIATLKSMGIRCMMLTGDNEHVAKAVSAEIGIDEYFAAVLPDKKAAKVKDVQARGLTVAMTGDGVNDAPALAQADVGIAIGTGTDVAAATADIVLVRSNPEDVVALIKLARATYRKMQQNLAWATGYNVFAIPLAAGILYPTIVLSPAVGAALMSLSTIIVAINARLLKKPQ